MFSSGGQLQSGITEMRKTSAAQTCIIFLWLLINGINGQGYYYEGGPVYYPEFSPGHDYYQLEPVQYGRGGAYEPDESMRALGGSHQEHDLTTLNYDFVAPNDISDTQRYDFTSARSTEVPRTYLEGYKQEKTTTGTYVNPVWVSDFKTTSNGQATAVQKTITEATSEGIPTDTDQTTTERNTTPDLKIKTTSHSREKSPQIDTTTAYPTPVRDNYITRNSLLPATSQGSTPAAKNVTAVDELPDDIRGINTSFSVTVANSSNCDPETHAGCDVIHYERCHPKTKHCQCLNGFLRSNVTEDSGVCKAVKFYHGHVDIASSLLDDQPSFVELQDIREKLLALIKVSLKNQGVDGFLDLEIRSVENQGQQMSLSFELGMDKASLSEQADLRHVLSHGLDLSQHSEGLLGTTPRGTTTGTSNNSASPFSPLVEVDPCVSQEHNHCSPHASCSYDLESVTCQCDPGYDDLSPNLYRLPGEVCIEKCKCHNGGLCVEVDVLSGKRQCSCLNWYFGSECQINGKELLLICCCSIGSLILLGLTMCCCYYGCAKHRDNAARSRMFPFSPDINILKLPRVWMDTTSFHDDLSPQNNRRMSIASERNPYFEGFLVEDIPMGTLQRHTETSSAYYPTPLAHCPATVSSHSFYRY